MSRWLFSSWLALMLLVVCVLPVQAGDPVDTGLDYLATQQQADGGFTNGFSEGSDLGTTCDVVLAIASSGQDASTWLSDDGNSPLDYLDAQVVANAVDKPGPKAKVVLALLAAGQDPAAWAGHDLIGELNATYDEASGNYAETVFDQALVMLALSGADQPVPDEAAQYLLDSQGDDGGWALFGDTEDGTGDTNTTALAIQALLVSGRRDGIEEALAYLHSVQNDDGGFPYQNPSEYGTDTDANSTAVVLQSLVAAGESVSDWAPDGTHPRDALLALYDVDSGGFQWQAAVPGPNVLATAQAIPALEGYTFVDLPRVEAASPPEAATPSGDVTLPVSGGLALLPLGLVALGIAALGAGATIRRR